MATIRGLTYPLTIENGSFATSEDIPLVREQIFSVLETEPQERVMNPAYGTPDYLFIGVQDMSLIAQYARQGLERQIPEPEFQATGQISDEGAGQIQVNWAIDGTPQAPLLFQLAS